MEQTKFDFKKQFIQKIKNLFSSFVRIFFGNTSSKIGSTIIIFFLFLGIFGPLIFPYSDGVNTSNQLQGASFAHPFGFDLWGRDVFRQCIDGTSNILIITFLTALITTSIGVVLGILSGLIGGVFDKFIQFVANVFLTIPSLPVFLILASLFTVESPFVFALILSIFNWAGLCRAVRAQIISLKERDFIQICKVMKMSTFHIVFKELLPNIASYIIINFIIVMKNAITGSVSLMFLGVVALEPTNWGTILSLAKTNGALINPASYMWLFGPIICIALLQTGAILLSNGLDETLNPRLRVM